MSTTETNPRCDPAHNAEIERTVDLIDALLTSLVAADSSTSTMHEAFGLTVRCLGQRLAKLGANDALLSAAQLIAIRHPRTRNERINILSKRWADIDDNDEAQE